MGIIGALWAVIGVSALLLNAIVRLASRGVQAFELELTSLQWVVMAAFTVFMLYSEGYKGFQKKFSPRTAARVKYLKENPTGARVLLAPFFAMGFFHATRKTLIIAWVLPVMIILLVLLVSQLPTPWREVIDVGVVLGLSYGLVSFWFFSLQAFTNKNFNRSPEVL